MYKLQFKLGIIKKYLKNEYSSFIIATLTGEGIEYTNQKENKFFLEDTVLDIFTFNLVFNNNAKNEISKNNDVYINLYSSFADDYDQPEDSIISKIVGEDRTKIIDKNGFSMFNVFDLLHKREKRILYVSNNSTLEKKKTEFSKLKIEISDVKLLINEGFSQEKDFFLHESSMLNNDKTIFIDNIINEYKKKDIILTKERPTPLNENYAEFQLIFYDDNIIKSNLIANLEVEKPDEKILENILISSILFVCNQEVLIKYLKLKNDNNKSNEFFLLNYFLNEEKDNLKLLEIAQTFANLPVNTFYYYNDQIISSKKKYSTEFWSTNLLLYYSHRANIGEDCDGLANNAYSFARLMKDKTFQSKYLKKLQKVFLNYQPLFIIANTYVPKADDVDGKVIKKKSIDFDEELGYHAFTLLMPHSVIAINRRENKNLSIKKKKKIENSLKNKYWTNRTAVMEGTAFKNGIVKTDGINNNMKKFNEIRKYFSYNDFSLLMKGIIQIRQNIIINNNDSQYERNDFYAIVLSSSYRRQNESKNNILRFVTKQKFNNDKNTRERSGLVFNDLFEENYENLIIDIDEVDLTENEIEQNKIMLSRVTPRTSATNFNNDSNAINLVDKIIKKLEAIKKIKSKPRSNSKNYGLIENGLMRIRKPDLWKSDIKELKDFVKNNNLLLSFDFDMRKDSLETYFIFLVFYFK